MSRQCRHISESVHLKRRSVVLRTPRRRKAPRSRSVDGVLRGRGAAAARQVALSRSGVTRAHWRRRHSIPYAWLSGTTPQSSGS